MSLVTDNEQPEVKKSKKSKDVQAKRTQLIYCGPNLKGGILNQYTVFRGDGLPMYLDKSIADCPAITRLFVPPSELNKTNQAINTKGTPESVWYTEIQTYVKGGAK